MFRRNLPYVLATAAAAMSACGAAFADDAPSGATRVLLDEGVLSRHNVRVEWSPAAESTGELRFAVFALDPSSTVRLTRGQRADRTVSTAHLWHAGQIVLHGPGGEIVLAGLDVRLRSRGENAAILDARGADVIALHDLRIELDQASEHVLIAADELRITPAAAKSLGAPELAETPVGALLARVQFAASAEPEVGERDATCGASTGPDVIVGHLPQMSSLGSVGDIAAFAVGTLSCNIGSTELLWIANQNKHPVIAQNLYRLKDNRFEQIGMSWLKHGFTALTGNVCACGCVDPHNGARLGVGCSDPYSSGLNANQTLLGPRSEVNSHTGEFLYPFSTQNVTGNAIYKRLQVHIADIDPGQNGGGLYFAEGHYLTPDDASAGNGDNNASYRRAGITGAGANWTASFSGMPDTVRGDPAIRAWQATDPSVVETDVRVPDEGLIILAARAEDLGGGVWRYEYAVQNLNSHRGIRACRVPVADSATVQNIGFHDVDYHSGEPFDGTDWPGVRTSGAVAWSTAAYATDPNANALRWGSLYNFRFDADQPPVATTVEFTLFRPGKPASPNFVFARTIGPAPQLLDCNSNGAPDALDIADGLEQDCNANGLPDSCESFAAVRLAAVEVAAGLDLPVAAASPPGDLARLFVCEQNTGRVRLIKNDVLLPAPFLDIGSLITTGGERGLLGIAFHPEYASNGRFFVNYTDTAGDTVIAGYTVSGDPDVADTGSATIIRTIAQDSAFHNGGQLAFGPDGMLYVGTGDGGGAAGDGLNRAQDTGSSLGKILRLDVDAPAPFVPPDNPFVGTTGLDEIWALGLRNPWRFSFDRLTGDLYIADVGESDREEIDFAPRASTGGENYGWRCYEGTSPFNLAGCGLAGEYAAPLLEYPHTDGACAVIGGFVYRGCALPQLRGTYFFADLCAGWVRSFRYQPGDALPPEVQDRAFELGVIDGAVVSFAEDAAGELYILTLAGKAYRIEEIQSIATCGDNVIEYGEQCDDGNTSFGDGCDQQCQLEGADVDVCGGALPLCPGASVVGSTVGAVSDGSAACGNASGSPAHWYAYTPAGNGVAVFSTCGSGFDTVLSVHDHCPGGAGTQLSCNDDGCGLAQTGSRAVIAVNAGETYLVRVAGYDGAAGNYALSVTGPGCTAVCGNGLLEIGEECEPPGASGCSPFCLFDVCEQPLFTEDFDAGLPAGWTLHAADSTASAGAWTVGNPDGTNTGGEFVQPENAYAGAGCAFTAANASLGGGDVDDGVTYLLSPQYNLLGLDSAKVRYARWFYNGTLGDDPDDHFIAQVSANDGASWATLESLDDSVQANAWAEVAFELGPLVPFTDQVRVRFGVADGSATDDLIEAAIDSFTISFCVDCNSNGVDDATDIANGISGDINTNAIPDDCEADGDPLRGGLLYDRWTAFAPVPPPTQTHPLWAYRPDLVSNPRTGIATWRCVECHGWDYQGISGAYATGDHRTGFPGIYGTTLSNEDLFELLDQPPSNGGGPGLLNGHALHNHLTAQDIRDLVAFVRLGAVDTPLFIDGGGLFIGNTVRGQTNYTTSPSGPSCRICHGIDGTNINFGATSQPVWLGTIAVDDPWEFLHRVRFGVPDSSMPQFLAHGTTQGAADIGAYVQQNFPTQCFLDSQCDDGKPCNGSETCGTNGCEPAVFTGCDIGCDHDCDVDLADFAIFQGCYTGPVGPGPAAYPVGCVCYDYDTDGDIDESDYAVFLTLLSGADVPAPGCVVP